MSQLVEMGLQVLLNVTIFTCGVVFGRRLNPPEKPEKRKVIRGFRMSSPDLEPVVAKRNK